MRTNYWSEDARRLRHTTLCSPQIGLSSTWRRWRSVTSSLPAGKRRARTSAWIRQPLAAQTLVHAWDHSPWPRTGKDFGR